MNQEHPTQWAVMPGGRFRPCYETVGELLGGAYACDTDDSGHAIFTRRELQVDELIDFPGSLPAKILEEIERFWTIGDRFKKYGFRHRRGYLLHGKQGSGKSSLIHLVISRAVKTGAVAFFCEGPHSFVTCVEQFRQVEPSRPILCIFEDIDTIVRRHGDSTLLQWLDGNLQVDRSISIATTNYPEKLDRRIVARPRRFDRVLEIESPDSRLREAYFTRKVPDMSSDECRVWVEASEGLSFAALAELIISVRCLDKDLQETAKLLKELDKHQPASEDYEEPKNDIFEDMDVPF
jgi:SpoVK/Ycf46/Vps4 family AAA+-type ATPase